jgi:hypothetical protein
MVAAYQACFRDAIRYGAKVLSMTDVALVSARSGRLSGTQGEVEE